MKKNMAVCKLLFEY